MNDSGSGRAQSFGAALKERRAAAGLSLRGLAKALPYSPGWISRLENDKVAPTLEFATKCDHLLGTAGELAALAQAAKPDNHGLLRPAQLPPDTGKFVGRHQVLDGLNTLLTSAEQAGTALTVAIDGPAGAGKSTLAVRWAHEISTPDRFPGGVLFIDLQGYAPDGYPVDAARALERFLVSIGLAAEELPPDRADRAAVLRTLTATRPTLIILDNAADSQHVGPLLVSAPGSVTVITSRRRLTGLAATAGAHRVSLGPLTPIESVDLLRSVLGPERVAAELDAARALAERCVHLPLALRIVAERLATHQHRRLTDAATDLTHSAARLDALADTDDPNLAMRSVLRCSYRELPPPFDRAFRLLGLYPGSVISAAAAGALLARTAVQARHILDGLVALHLLEETGPERYRRHDLLRDYAAELCVEVDSAVDREAAASRLAAWYAHTIDRACWALAPQRPIERLGELPTDVEPLDFPSAEAAGTWCDAEADSFVSIVRLAARYELTEAWEIPTRLWNWLLFRKPWSVWIDSHETALTAATMAGDTAGQAWISMNLGEAYRQSGDTDRARELLQQSLDLRCTLGDRHGQAWTHACLGFTSADEDDPIRSRPEFERALRLFEETGDRHGQAVVLACLAEAHSLLGQSALAQQAFDDSLAITRALGDHYAEGVLWARRAGAHHQSGEYEDAVDCFDRSIASRRTAADDWGVADALDRRAEALVLLGRKDDARRSWDEALELFGQLSDPRAAVVRERLTAC
ncbi:helix-turn-helix domain-containing protein [Streptomyces celluloflavus]|uniref:helix-turn-helix domain-containing protein n=1 Tax=Streptomyces celluloflavus TaxID=58344 RepID=UPI00365977F5